MILVTGILLSYKYKQEVKKWNDQKAKIDKHIQESFAERDRMLEEARHSITLAEVESRKALDEEFALLREIKIHSINTEAEREYTRQVALMKEELHKYSTYIDEEFAVLADEFLERSEEARAVAASLEAEVEDTAARLVALIEAEKSLLDESRQKTLMLPLSREDIADLRLLMEDILPRIRREDVIRKLIWVEYIQKPTFALVSDVFPMGTPGIYKITNTKTKKSYVGRSVDTRARVVEHIKSSLGLGSISDQAIHHAMREEGLENFMFELLEDCEKDKLAEREKYYIGIFQSDTHGYNKNKGG